MRLTSSSTVVFQNNVFGGLQFCGKIQRQMASPWDTSVKLCGSQATVVPDVILDPGFPARDRIFTHRCVLYVCPHRRIDSHLSWIAQNRQALFCRLDVRIIRYAKAKSYRLDACAYKQAEPVSKPRCSCAAVHSDIISDAPLSVH